MIREFMQNCRSPQGFLGSLMLVSMNFGHSNISLWGLSHLHVRNNAHVLDIGCGGGANIKRLLAMCPQGRVDGIDYSEQSVLVSRKKNRTDMGKRCNIRQGSVSKLPYDDGIFDIITAFETVYFWPELSNDFREVYRVLKPGGSFLICNEASDPTDETWTDKIDGMRIYSSDELTRLLIDTGFTVMVKDTQGKGRLCLIAKKEWCRAGHARGRNEYDNDQMRGQITGGYLPKPSDRLQRRTKRAVCQTGAKSPSA